MIDLSKIGVVTSGFGKRTAPTKGASSNHKGIDIVLSSDKIPAITNGKIVSKGYNSSKGNYVTYATNDGAEITYMHMAQPTNLSVGNSVTEGEILGKQGKTGIATGKHVHIGIKENGKSINPLAYMSDETFSSSSSKFDDSFLSTIVTIALMLFIGFLAFQFFMRFIGSTKIIKIVKG